MNLKLIGIGIISLILIIGGIWGFMIKSYEEDLGTTNIFVASDSSNNLTTERNNSLLGISFSKADEDLEWTKLSISIENSTEKMDCSKGNFTSKDIGKEKVSPKLSSDGFTFTVTVDATSEDKFTHVNLDKLMEVDETNFDIRFSKTDIYLSENVTGTIVENINFESLKNAPEQDYTETSKERLDWYDYKITTHRIEAEEKIYVINIEERYYKIKFISYYNEIDEPRYISFMIGALNNTEFSALANPDLVSPAKCTIIELGEKNDTWEMHEEIAIFENDYDICETYCVLTIIITYEDIEMKGTSKVQLE